MESCFSFVLPNVCRQAAEQDWSVDGPWYSQGGMETPSFNFRAEVADSHTQTMGLIFSFPPNLKLKSMMGKKKKKIVAQFREIVQLSTYTIYHMLSVSG